MKNILLIIFLLGATMPFCNAQSSKAALTNELVKIENGKWIINYFTLLSYSDKSTKQVKSHAEAPAVGVISRDYFVALVTTVVYEMIYKGSADANIETKDLDEITGNPDIEINVFMSKTGLQIEYKEGANVKRNTVTWDDMFK